MNNFLTKIILLLALGLLSWSTLDAQRNGDADKRKQGQAFIGINAGGAWQQADIRPSGGGGLGFYIGSNLYYKPTSFFSLDWRFRYLFTYTTSKDYKATTLSSSHPLGGGSRVADLNFSSPIDELYNYNNIAAGGRGYAFLNNQTFFNDLSLELRLNFEKLRQKTNIWLSIYGGGGLGIYHTFADQADNDLLGGSLYNYGAIDQTASSSSILSQLNNMRDGDYETDMTDLKARYMSNVGFELGYWFTPYFAAGVGHRLTFTHTDLFDGEYSDVRKGKDLHHYAHLFTHWTIGRGSATSTVITSQPVITTVSHRCGETISQSQGTFKYKVTNVMDASQIKIYVNGSETTNFSYSRKTEQLTLITAVNTGENIIVIQANNGSTSNTLNCSINSTYNSTINNNTPPPPVPNNNNNVAIIPTVRITAPANNTTVTNCNTSVAAVATNAETVYIVVNGQRIATSNNNSDATFNVALQKGANTIVVHAINKGNTQTSTVTVYCNEPQIKPVIENKKLPTVKFTLPVGNPFTTSNNNIDLTAITTNIDFRSQITVNVNGSNTSNFQFTNQNTVTINNVRLNHGNNTISISVSNDDGSDSDSKVVVYQQQLPVNPPVPPVIINRNPPTVQFTAPNGNPYSSTASAISLTAITTNITTQSQLSVTVNNRNHTNFTFNSARRTVTINNVNLNEGNNSIVIIAQNNDGQASDNKVVVYNAPRKVTPPTVQFTAPAGNPFTSNTNTVTLTAVTTNITTQSQVAVTVNNTTYTNVIFNAQRNTVTINNVALNEGNNTVAITVRNNDGQSSDSKVVVYNAPRQVTPPTVQFTAPAGNPFTSNTNTVTLTAITTNITTQSQVAVTVNNTTYTNVFFNSQRNTISINSVALNEGNNTVAITVRNNDGQASDSKVIVYNAPRQVTPPTVQFTAPAGNPFTASSNTINLTATTTNIVRQNQITVTVNNTPYTTFTFNASRNSISINNVMLNEGNNTINVSVRNEDGQASDSKVVVYNAPRQVTPPTVQFTAPAGNPFTSDANTVNLTAVTTNIEAQSQVTVTVNNRAYRNFNFEPSSKIVSINTVTLNEGNNTVNISVANADGTASDSKVVVYNAPRQVTPPTVQFTNPVGNPYSSSTQVLTLTATTTNITQRGQVSVTVGSRSYTNFAFSNNVVTINNVSLIQGESQIIVNVQNEDGQASDSKTVIYKQVAPPPTVSITTPSANPHIITANTQTIVATTTNIANRNNVIFRLNGMAISDFQFANNVITAINLPMSDGNNNIDITVDNGVGTASASTVVRVEQPSVQAPIISNMNATQSQSRSGISVQVSANIQHHTTTNGIVFTANGQTVTNFTLSNGIFTALNVPFQEGNNVYTIVINGEGGRATMSCTLNQSAGTTESTNNGSGRGDATGGAVNPSNGSTRGGSGSTDSGSGASDAGSINRNSSNNGNNNTRNNSNVVIPETNKGGTTTPTTPTRTPRATTPTTTTPTPTKGNKINPSKAETKGETAPAATKGNKINQSNKAPANDSAAPAQSTKGNKM